MEQHRTMEEIEAQIARMGQSPVDHGTIVMIVARPEIGERQVLEEGELTLEDGLSGDTWRARGSSRTEDGSANVEAQITLMNSRVIEAIAGDQSRWPLAGDQFFVDFDLSMANLPPGQRIALGTAVLEISETPHTGCDKFTERFGHAAIRFVNSKEGRAHRVRGVNARVIQAGKVRVGDRISRLAVSVASS